MKSSPSVRTSYQLSLLCIALLAIFCALPALVQADCGSITYIDVMNGMGEFSEEITDCNNPFGLELGSGEVQSVAHAYNGIEFGAGDTIIVDKIPTPAAITSIAKPDNPDWSVFNRLYYHDGDSYTVYENLPLNYIPPFVATGTYTLVSEVLENIGPVFQVQRNWYEVLIDWMLPTVAYAQLEFNPGFLVLIDTTIITFAVELAEPEPVGASSVLFLPGIQASRLYKDGALGTEDQLWEPSVNRGQDITDLRMNEAGQSVNDVYTKFGDVIGRTNYLAGADLIVYDTWLERLEAEKIAGVINDYKVFAYDWRYDVRDIVANGTIVGSEQTTLFPTNELVKLARATPSKKVTIVAHSNGGLLAKAMLQSLEKSCTDNPTDQCPLEYIDKLILLGSPQLGTPEAINRLLHGLEGLSRPEQLVLEPISFRRTVRNLPGANALLPSAAYFESLSNPMITFTGIGAYLSDIRMLYPNGIENQTQLKQFLTGAEGRKDPRDAELEKPTVLNDFIVRQGLEAINSLSAYEIPENIEVIEIVGTGVLTTAGIIYDSTFGRNCFFSCGDPAVSLTKVRPQMSLYGDQTVMTLSAEGYQGAKETYYVDLLVYNLLASDEDSDDILPALHANLSEPAGVQDLIFALMSRSALPDSDYITTTLPAYDGESYDGLSTHSPVHLVAKDSNGNQTGVTGVIDGFPVIVQNIPGSRFFQIGSSSYLYIPSATEYEVFIDGYAEGSFSLIIEDIVEGEPTKTRFRREDITTTLFTTAVFAKEDDVFSNVRVDIDGDGVVDEVYSPSGQLVSIEQVAIKVTDSQPQSSSATRVGSRAPSAQVLGIATSTSVLDQSDSAVVISAALQQLAQVLQQRSYLTAGESQVLTELLQALQQALVDHVLVE